ncbi:hypothetical protein [Methylobacterium marchantiae]|uniref:Uncharacterized protein n=1 Tax=Methylobacterium marchantiae TaxID=600331 RepID=A0ABW3X1W3_9HYPH|nr:hypothetical protein AIGOOFII_3469 [Methylobacterium marchantiae]
MTDQTSSNVVAHPASERTALVHKTDHEGVLIINALDGRITMPLMDRPEWADGYAVALLSERHGFYATRLGAQYADEHKFPEAFNVADLAWLVVNEDQDLVEIDADSEYRMDVLADAFGMDREAGAITGKDLTEIELSLDRTRTEGEVAALETAQEHGFGSATKDGTNG